MKISSARLARVNNFLQWDRKHGGVIIRLPIDNNYLHMLFYVHSKLAFKHLLTGLNLPDSQVKFPEGITSESNIL